MMGGALSGGGPRELNVDEPVKLSPEERKQLFGQSIQMAMAQQSNDTRKERYNVKPTGIKSRAELFKNRKSDRSSQLEERIAEILAKNKISGKKVSSGEPTTNETDATASPIVSTDKS